MRTLVPQLRAALVGCGLLLLSSAVSANMAPPWWRADLMVEPKGVKEVAIVHEELTIDLRPLADLQLAKVEVVYRLNNPKGARKVELVFITGAVCVQDFEVRLGSQPGEGRLVPTETRVLPWDNIPDNWRPPQRECVPAFDGNSGTAYRTNYPRYIEDGVGRAGYGWPLLAFTLELPRGPSTLSVHYRATLGKGGEKGLVTTWVFPYVLAPAREWGGFGALDVTVHLPEGWEAKSSPDLTRDGDVLRGHFEGLPADHLLVITRAPIAARARRMLWLCVGLLVLAVVLGGVLCWRVGRWDEHGTGVAAIVMPLLWAAMVPAVWLLTKWVMNKTLAEQKDPYFDWHYTDYDSFPGCGGVCLMLVLFCSGYVVSFYSRRPEPAAQNEEEKGRPGPGSPT